MRYVPRRSWWLDSPQWCDSLMILKNYINTKRGFDGAKIFYRENVLAYSQTQFTGSMPLLIPNHCLQGACPCLSPTTAYREHALAYPQPLLTGSMPLLIPNHCLQGACPCLSPTTAYREHALAYPQPLLTGSMPLLIPNHCLQGAWPCLPPTTAYREHALAYPQPLLTGRMPLLIPNHCLQGACPCPLIGSYSCRCWVTIGAWQWPSQALELCVECGHVNHRWCVCVVSHGYGGLSWDRDGA